VAPLRLRFQLSDRWPALAWLAHGRRGEHDVDLIHGPRVEVGSDWFCEAVWDGEFGEGELDRTDIVFGSGARVRGDHVTFVSSATTVDRLQTLESGDDIWISNSLPCLLAATGAELDRTYPHYFRDFSSIRLGLARYESQLRTSRGPVRLVYFNNLTWDGSQLRVVPKPGPARDFSSFERYRGFLATSLQRLARNAGDTARRHPYHLLGTISSGYDSPTVTALAREAGLRDVISFESGANGASDSGHEIANRLGLRVTVVPRDAWRGTALAEVPFLAADAKGEDVYFTSAGSTLSGAVLLTGYHGDKAWGTTTTSLGPDLVRGDQSGLSLTEYRLRVGFLHCPVPFMGIRQIADIHRLSRSAELSRWDVGGDYTRPICRRIVEEAGVPRQLFGIEKKASSVLFFRGSSFLTPEALSEYLPWLEAHALGGSSGPGWGRVALDALGGVARGVERLASAVGLRAAARVARLVANQLDREPRFRWLFPWATELARAPYAKSNGPATMR